MRWGRWTSRPLRRWFVVGLLLLIAGLVAHFAGGRWWDPAWLVLTLAAAVAIVAGYYRHPPTHD